MSLPSASGKRIHGSGSAIVKSVLMLSVYGRRSCFHLEVLYSLASSPLSVKRFEVKLGSATSILRKWK
jgi:hypothetical protein